MLDVEMVGCETVREVDEAARVREILGLSDQEREIST